ncbi:hypothetical protein OTK49_01820 [Vibrio coralliirubri]|uniref:hypothetical protein n=1 Tax=Vibrio coralliirubri TaxID=1516159 RepID=UPI0022852CDB|nr:hypothetical protein [Vibrio coralliirubri]MCY9861251.1 hypothetical protein [Vibrio coralliirubri]
MSQVFEFEIVVGGIEVNTDEQLFDISDKLYEAGCSDATVLVENGTVIVCFDREADTLESAIESGKNDINKVEGIYAASALDKSKSAD